MAKVADNVVAALQKLINKIKGADRCVAEEMLAEYQRAVILARVGSHEGRREYWQQVSGIRLTRLNEFIHLGK